MSIRGFAILAAGFAVIMADQEQSEAVEVVLDGINQFAPAFFREVSNSVFGNLIISPLGTSIALAIFGYGSSGKTEKEFKRVLHLPDKSIGKIGYATLIDSLNSATDIEFRLANRIFINDEYTIEPTYHELIHTTFRSSFHKSNFANTEKAVARMNEWIQENVNNTYTEILTPDIFPENPNMVLVNVIYFKANWLGAFRRLLGSRKPFHVSPSETEYVPFMHRFGRCKYGALSELKIKFIELPYENEGFSMVIILPDTIDGLDEVEEKLAYQDLNEILEAVNTTRVQISLPKFKIESTIDLVPHLKNMGLKTPFDEDAAEFTEIFDLGLYLDNFVQKTIIQVDEVGTYTEGIYRVGGVPRGTKVFHVDHPFYVSILKKDALTNRKFEIFSARVKNPVE